MSFSSGGVISGYLEDVVSHAANQLEELPW
jgi:hypothetical protein